MKTGFRVLGIDACWQRKRRGCRTACSAEHLRTARRQLHETVVDPIDDLTVVHQQRIGKASHPQANTAFGLGLGLLFRQRKLRNIYHIVHHPNGGSDQFS